MKLCPICKSESLTLDTGGHTGKYFCKKCNYRGPLIIKMEKINKAGIIYNPGNSIKNKTGSWRILKPIVNKEKCTGCGKCWASCPDNAIEIKNKKIKINYDYCKGCGICASVCPLQGIKMEKENK